MFSQKVLYVVQYTFSKFLNMIRQRLRIGNNTHVVESCNVVFDDQGTNLRENEDVEVLVPKDHIQIEGELENERYCIKKEEREQLDNDDRGRDEPSNIDRRKKEPSKKNKSRVLRTIPRVM